MLAPSGSSSKWHSVTCHGSSVRQASLPIDKQRSVEITRDHTGSGGINRNDCKSTEISLNSGSTDIRDQNESFGITCDNTGSIEIVRDQQETSTDPQRSLDVTRNHNEPIAITIDSVSTNITGDQYGSIGITGDQKGSLVTNTNQGSICSTINPSSLGPTSLIERSSTLPSNTCNSGSRGINIDTTHTEVPCITIINEAQEENVYSADDIGQAEQMSGVTAAASEILDLSFKSPRRKG